MSNIPTDILLEEILPRCAAKSLLRFKSVGKSFNTLISSSQFIKLHLNHCCHNSNRILFLNYGRKSRISSGICYVDLQSLDSPVVPLPLPKFLRTSKDSCINIVGSCNGLICLKNDESCSILLNLCTNKYIEIPSLIEFYKEIKREHRNEIRSMKFGFGFDSFNDDYKVVVIVDSDIVVDHLFPDDVDVANEITREVFVYSMNFKSWRLIEGTSSSRDGVLSGENGVLINTHLLHWVFQSSDSHENRIGCFDLRTDKWVQDVPLPNYYKNHGTNWCNFYDDKKINVVHIGVLDKCLCLLTDNPSNVWIMKEYGVKESWVKLLGVSDSQITQSLKFCPLAYRGVASNEVLVRKINQRKKASELVWYNVHEKKFQRVDQIFKSRKVYGFLDAYVCEGSLVDLPGGLKL